MILLLDAEWLLVGLKSLMLNILSSNTENILLILFWDFFSLFLLFTVDDEYVLQKIKMNINKEQIDLL